jgi:hypothetical protein
MAKSFFLMLEIILLWNEFACGAITPIRGAVSKEQYDQSIKLEKQ